MNLNLLNVVEYEINYALLFKIKKLDYVEKHLQNLKKKCDNIYLKLHDKGFLVFEDGYSESCYFHFLKNRKSCLGI